LLHPVYLHLRHLNLVLSGEVQIGTRDTNFAK